MSDLERALLDEGVEFSGPLTDQVFPDEEDKERLVSYLQTEHEAVLEGPDRQEFLEAVKVWRRQRDARPEAEVKNTPWPNASNMATPATAIVTNGIFTQLVARFSGQDKLFVVESDDPAWHETAAAITRMLKIISEGEHRANLPKKNNDIFLDAVSLGTQFVSVPWRVRRMQFNRVQEGGGTEVVDRVTYQGPDVEVPLIEDVVTRPYWKDLDTAPWVTVIHRMYGYQLRQAEANGFFEDVSRVERTPLTEVEENFEDEAQRAGIQIDYETSMDLSKPYEVYRTFVFWDADGDGVAEDLELWWEPTTGAILRTEYNELGSRDIVRLPYIDRPGLLYGRGVGWYAQLLQDEIDTYHNMRNNSIHVSSLQMFLTRSGRHSGRRETFFPLKAIQVEDPKNDFLPITFPDVSQSTLQAEMLTRQYLQQVVAAGDALLGQGDSQAKTRATAAGGMQQLQANLRIVNAIQESLAESYGKIGLKMLLRIVSNAEESIESIVPLLPREDQPIIEKLLRNVSVEDIPSLLKVRVEIASQEDDEQVKRQGLMMIFTLYTQYVQQFMQLSMTAAQDQLPPEAKEAAARGMVGFTNLMEKILLAFKEKGTGTYLPYVEGLDLMLDMIDQQRRTNYQVAREQLSGQEAGGLYGSSDGGQMGAGATGGPQPGGPVPGGPGGSSPGMGGAPGAGTGAGGTGPVQGSGTGAL